MYLAVDIGGTKTLLANFNNRGELLETVKFPTPRDYDDFLHDFKHYLQFLDESDYQAAAAAIPGVVDREHGRGLVFGNLPWRRIPIQSDIERIILAPVIIENDAKAGGLFEALNIKNEFKKVLYVTIGTGIGVAFIKDGIIDINLSDSGGKTIMLEHKGKMRSWESFASGSAILKQFGKKAQDITNEEDWKIIARNLATGLINLLAVIQPEVVILGGGVGQYYPKFSDYLNIELKRYEMPMVPLPHIRVAQQPEEAVIYGCYELVRQKFSHQSKAKRFKKVAKKS